VQDVLLGWDIAPGDVLARANDVLCPDIPPKMFVTCLYAVIDTATGLVRYANAGHDAPYVRRSAGGVEELRALAARFGVNGVVQQRTALVDPRMQWSAAGDVWHNAAVRTTLYAPVNAARRLFRQG
jgi:hypothetical protein